MFLLTGVARYLFVPLAEAVVFAMLASYFFSRTLVPTLAKYLLRARPHERRRRASRWNPLGTLPSRVRARLRRRARRLSRAAGALHARTDAVHGAVPARAASPRRRCCRSSAATSSRPWTPASSSCTCAPRPARASRRPRACATWSKAEIRAVIPAERARDHHRQHRPAAVAAPTCRTTTRARSAPPTPTSMVSLKPRPSPDRGLHPDAARSGCPRASPASTFYFLPADIVSQILNFGLPAPIDIQIIGRNIEANRDVRARSAREAEAGARASSICASSSRSTSPSSMITVDRTKAQQVGLLAARRREQPADLAVGQLPDQSVASGSIRKNGVSYNIITQTPQYRIDSLQALSNIPINGERRRERRDPRQPRDRERAAPSGR